MNHGILLQTHRQVKRMTFWGGETFWFPLSSSSVWQRSPSSCMLEQLCCRLPSTLTGQSCTLRRCWQHERWIADFSPLSVCRHAWIGQSTKLVQTLYGQQWGMTGWRWYACSWECATQDTASYSCSSFALCSCLHASRHPSLQSRDGQRSSECN